MKYRMFQFINIFLPGIIAISLMIMTNEAGLAQPVYKSFRPGEMWFDTDSNIINAHGGGILFHEGVYYWFGEYRYGRDKPSLQRASPGVSCYTSTDLYNWTFKGIVMRTVDEQGHDIERGAIMERPKVIYNKQTAQFVMWFHLELKGQGYGPAHAAVAVASSPTGPYEFLESKRPLAGHWPRDFTERQRQPLPGAYIAMFDMWRPGNQIDSRYMWLPIIINNGRFIVHWLNEWDLSFFESEARKGLDLRMVKYN